MRENTAHVWHRTQRTARSNDRALCEKVRIATLIAVFSHFVGLSLVPAAIHRVIDVDPL